MSADHELVQDLFACRKAIKTQISGRVVGQHRTIDAVLVAIFAGGHSLLVGAPGLAKTLLVHTVAESLGWSFNRIQFTPDLMPSDITGTEILYEDRERSHRELRFVAGPVFANLVLADEINRTPPKTQAALLEAMQECSVTMGGKRHQLPDPFFVLATQNPIEQEGTYHLPEAQLDRFALSINVDYPNEDEECSIALLDVRNRAAVSPVLDIERFRVFSSLVARLPVAEVAVRYAVRLARASRPTRDADPWIREHVGWGAGPRASQHLIAAARAIAALQGKLAVDPQMVTMVAGLVLGHRVIPSFQAAGNGVSGSDIIAHLLKKVVI